jgi:uncharacterized protein YaaQ
MKLLFTVVRDDDANEVVEALTEHGFGVTRLASTGCFLRVGNTVLLSGIDDDQVDQMLEVLAAHTDIHVVPPTSKIAQETEVRRAVVFILNLEQVVKL